MTQHFVLNHFYVLYDFSLEKESPIGADKEGAANQKKGSKHTETAGDKGVSKNTAGDASRDKR